MSSKGDKFRKKNYTDFDARLDRELEEEILERQKQIRQQAPDLDLLERQIRQGTAEIGLAEKLKQTCSYFLCYDMEEAACRTMGIFREAIRGYGGVRSDLIGQAGLLGCLAFRQNMAQAGEACADAVAQGMQYLEKEETETLDRSYGFLRNIADISLRTRNEASFFRIVAQIQAVRERQPGRVPSGLLALLQDLLFMASDRRQTDALRTVCRISRDVLRDPALSAGSRRKFALEWSATAAQIAQRGWTEETRLLLSGLCRFLAAARDSELTRALLTDFALHIQMQSHWDGTESAFALYYPCQLFALFVLRRAEVQYLKVVPPKDGPLPAEREEALVMIRFLLRNARDIIANSARLNMQDEWQVYTAWRKLWLTAEPGKEGRQKRIRKFLQLTAEYWRRSQPSSSRRQWAKMAEVMWPSVLSAAEYGLLDQLV